jgi:hypothetical protein
MGRWMDRRRVARKTLNNSAIVQMELQTWLNMRAGWSVVRCHARSFGRWERMARAEAKMACCDIQIQRSRFMLNLPERRRAIRSGRAWPRDPEET